MRSKNHSQLLYRKTVGWGQRPPPASAAPRAYVQTPLFQPRRVRVAEVLSPKGSEGADVLGQNADPQVGGLPDRDLAGVLTGTQRGKVMV